MKHTGLVIAPLLTAASPPTAVGADAAHDAGPDHLTICSATDTTASLDLIDPSDRSVVVHVELAVRGTELRVDARVGTTAGDGGTGMDAGAGRVLSELGQAFVLADDERFFRLGERNVTVDHRGQHSPALQARWDQAVRPP